MKNKYARTAVRSLIYVIALVSVVCLCIISFSLLGAEMPESVRSLDSFTLMIGLIIGYALSYVGEILKPMLETE
ncbi:hypothetical protein [Halalkalibacter hemicellulosilyticus]|uniref:Uncharacterized protein n=1 Tax=Halalkalibacter hemicellulosilyticusJCM 9152 TaxID=1236971 RepID=W4QL60_9BACI|nr:hypothetical protein [Halalkalibacter hemicellulosilyticus]GAE32855.1 hypothetical protein JCM9152_4442 [Halalkalibacter hemicellulosilyticusJCM 9152]